MPEQLVILIAIAGIVIVGLAFTSIDLIKDAGKLIGLALLAFLAILLLNRTMPSSAPSSTYSSSPTAPSYPPGSYPSGSSPSGTYPPGTYSPGTYSPGAYPPGTYPSTPYAAQPNPATNPAIPNSSSKPFSADSALNGLSGFVKTAFDRIDEFVYGNPYAVDQPSRSLQPDTSVSQQPATAEQPIDQPAEPGYQIRPDGVPSRVSSPVESAAPVTRPATSTANSRAVSAWW
jgi:hypothetical protein